MRMSESRLRKLIKSIILENITSSYKVDVYYDELEIGVERVYRSSMDEIIDKQKKDYKFETIFVNDLFAIIQQGNDDDHLSYFERGWKFFNMRVVILTKENMKKNYGPRIIKNKLREIGANKIVMAYRDIVKDEQGKSKTIRACFDMKYYYFNEETSGRTEEIDAVEVRNNLIEKIKGIFAF